MQQISEVVDQAYRQTTQAGSTPSTRINPSEREWAAKAVNQVIHQLKAIFPAWTAALKTAELEAEARRQWLLGLIEGGIDTDVKIRAGLARCRAHDSPFLPSVGQFVAWCNEAAEEIAGLPPESTAYRQLVAVLSVPTERRDWSALHPAIYWVFREIGSWSLARMSEVAMRKEFSVVWTDARRLARDGFNFGACLPKPDEVKAPESVMPCDPEVVETARRELQELISSIVDDEGEDSQQ